MACRIPIERLVFIETGTVIDPSGGMTFPARSTVVQVQLGFALTIVNGRSEVFVSVTSDSSVLPGCTTPKLTGSGITMMGGATAVEALWVPVDPVVALCAGVLVFVLVAVVGVAAVLYFSS